MSALNRNGRLRVRPVPFGSEEHRLMRGDRTIPIAGKVFDTLLRPAERHGQLVSKNDLLKSVWPETVVEENNLDRSISTLRKAARGRNPLPRETLSKPCRVLAIVSLLRSPFACPKIHIPALRRTILPSSGNSFLRHVKTTSACLCHGRTPDIPIVKSPTVLITLTLNGKAPSGTTG